MFRNRDDNCFENVVCLKHCAIKQIPMFDIVLQYQTHDQTIVEMLQFWRTQHDWQRILKQHKMLIGKQHFPNSPSRIMFSQKQAKRIEQLQSNFWLVDHKLFSPKLEESCCSRSSILFLEQHCKFTMLLQK